MAQTGDTYLVRLKQSHLAWGTYRRTNTRGSINGEGYIQIPVRYARRFSIYNSNYQVKGLGYNMFNVRSVDGFLNNVVLLAQGCSSSGYVYAKQFSIRGDLKTIGDWYSSQGATTNNYVRVTWISPIDVVLEII